MYVLAVSRCLCSTGRLTTCPPTTTVKFKLVEIETVPNTDAPMTCGANPSTKLSLCRHFILVPRVIMSVVFCYQPPYNTLWMVLDS